jgi:hypothetical protein
MLFQGFWIQCAQLHHPRRLKTVLNFVGLLAAELQAPDLIFFAGIPAKSRQPVAAKELIDFLTVAAAKPVYKAKGVEPD